MLDISGILKSLVFELISKNDLRMPDMSNMKALQSPSYMPSSPVNNSSNYRPELGNYFEEPNDETTFYPRGESDDHSHIILETPQKRYDVSETVDENLNMEDHEKDLIRKALKKHNNRRKEAASDLGISERTLYRKIKQYEL